ncbi:MAG: transposase [Planctomycetes bacterium]|nr:transposase [Planctomycetota bacterium]
MDILALKAARGWSLAQAAKIFLVDANTLATWFKRLGESGPDALVKMPVPVNRFPNFVRHVVQRLRAVCPALGKVKLAQTLARAGLHLAASTVGRLLKEKPDSNKPGDTNAASATPCKSDRVVRADYPNHVWHVDLTTVPIGGFWTPWLPFALPQCFPFCWWVAAIIDHFSRKVMGIAVFRKQPNCRQIRDFLAKAIRKAKALPRYIICDKGGQFWCMPFKRWCRRRKIRPRFGAVHKHGSIAVIERFILTMKNECFRRSIVPLWRKEFIRQAENYIDWHNRFRPHTTLHGRTPQERYLRIPAACRRPRFEPRPCWPVDSACASPQAKIRGQPGVVLGLSVAWHHGCRNLPVVSLNRVA